MEERTPCRQCPILCLFFCMILATKMASSQIIPVKVGVVLDTDDYAQMTLTCINMALLDFYSNHGYYRTRLVLTHLDSRGDVVGAADAALDLLKNIQVQAIVGPMYSDQATFLVALGNKAQVPIITFSATSPSLSSLRSPYFIRSTLNDSSQVDAIAAIVKAFGWREVVTVSVDNEFGEGIEPYLVDALENVNALVPYRSLISPIATDDQISTELYKLMTMQTRVFVVHMLSSLASRFFTKAKQLGMMSQEYVWIITDGVANELNSMNRSVIESMLGVIGVKPYVPRTTLLNNFTAQYKRRIQENGQVGVIPDFDIFGLWAYDSVVALAMAVENVVKIAPTYQEVNVSMNSTDLEKFGKSEIGLGLVQALMKTLFRGLSGDYRLVNGQLQSPPYEIINMVGPGDRVVGYWTKDNGIVRELNIKSLETNAYTTSKSNLGSIIWPDDPSSPPKGWVIPTNGKRLRVGVPVKEGFTEFVRVTWDSENSTKVEGYCIDVFDAVMNALPYGVPYDYVPFAAADHEMAGDYNALAYQVYLGNFDAVAGDVTVVANRSQYVDFTLPYTDSGVSMVVPIQENNHKNTWLFLKPLTWELWLTSFCSFVFIGVLIWILEHRINKDFRGPFWYQVGMVFWFSFSTMVFAQKERVVSNLSRILLIIWFLVVLILTQSYTASLTSMLTVQNLQPTVNDLSDLIKSHEYIGYMDGSFVEEFLIAMKVDPLRLKVFGTMDEWNELLSKGSKNGGIAASFHEIPYIKLFLGKYGSKYTTTGPTYRSNGFGFVFPMGSPLVPDVSRAILNVTESQEIVGIEKKWLGDNRIICPGSGLNSPSSLGLGSFWGLFLIVGIVGIIALIIFLAKFLCENWSVLERSDPESNIRTKIVELVQRFNNKDLSSHTFKKILGDGVCRNCMNSPLPNGNISPQGNCFQQTPESPLSEMPLLQFQGDERRVDDESVVGIRERGESSQEVNPEIELTSPIKIERMDTH